MTFLFVFIVIDCKMVIIKIKDLESLLFQIIAKMLAKSVTLIQFIALTVETMDGKENTLSKVCIFKVKQKFLTHITYGS